MVTKKLFALASVSALAGLMTSVAAAGCSSTTTETTTTDASDAKADVVKHDAIADDDADQGPACPAKPDKPITADVLDQEIGWKPAKAAPGSCTQADLTKLEANFKDTNLKTYFDLGNGLSPDCVTCTFSKDTDANWQPIVGTAMDNGMTGFINFGACFGSKDGDACGKALQYEQFCYNIVCNQCATTQTEHDQCVQAAGMDQDICGALGDATGKACPNLQANAKACNTIIDAVTTLCGAPASDAGAEGG